MKTREEIRETTKGKIPRPSNYQYGVHLPEWELAETTLSRDQFIRQVEPMHDRIVVQLLNEPQTGAIQLTDAKPLIGGCRKAKVLKVGPGRRMFDDDGYWRRPVDVKPGQIVLIGNWVDLELEDIALCQEGDIRSIWEN